MNERTETIQRIRRALKRRSGKTWSVKGGRGTAYCWIDISSPPTRCGDFGRMTDADRDELTALLGLDRRIHTQGVQVPPCNNYWPEYIDRAEGRTPSAYGVADWD